MAKISNLKDTQGNILYPITSTSALVDSNGQQFQPAKDGESYTKTESDERYGNYLTTWSGSATRNGDIISSGNCRYVVIGNVVIVNIEEVVFTSTTQAHDSVYFAGLPKAKTAPIITLTGWGSGVYQPRAYMDWTGTTLRNYWSVFTPSTAPRYTCTFMYIKE